MNISDKPQPDPVAAIPLSDAHLRWLLLAVEDVAGKQGITTVLRQAGLANLIDNYPPENTSVKGQYTIAQYSNVSTSLLMFFGRGGRSIVTRAGRVSYMKGVEHYGALLGAALTALRLLPSETRLKAGLEAIKFIWDKLYKDAGLPTLNIRTEDCGDHFKYRTGSCLGCAGKNADAPICYTTVGMLMESFKWLTGKEYEVHETECRAMGAHECVFQINKTPRE